MMEKKKSHPEIIYSESLKVFFFEQLRELNKQTICPIPEELIYYSSEVLEHSALSSHFYSFEEGKAKKKALGMELLKAESYSLEKKKRAYKDIGDTALVMAGYFCKSFNDKILGSSYYVRLGELAYQKLDGAQSRCFDIPCFYKAMATSFEKITGLMSVVMERSEGNQKIPYLLNLDGMGQEKKVS